MEIWRDIKDYEGIYQVSNKGRVKSLKYGKERILKPVIDGVGYYMVGLHDEGKQIIKSIHQMVAFAFPEICGEYFEGAIVNHKDENKLNNNAENLEWCTYQYNNTYGVRLTNAAKSKSKPVIQYDFEGNVIKEYPSLVSICKELGYNRSYICDCCNGKQKTAYGYIWRYKKAV